MSDPGPRLPRYDDFFLLNEPFAREIAARPHPPLARALASLGASTDPSERRRIAIRIDDALGKLQMAWLAGRKTLMAERELRDVQYAYSVAVAGEEGVELQYHLEAYVLFTRAFLDLASQVYSWQLRPPLATTRDSFNDLRKDLRKTSETRLATVRSALERLESEPTSWLNLLCSFGERRSLRDILAHKAAAPIEYVEISPTSEREACHVRYGGELIPLERFVDGLLSGVLDFCELLERAD